MLEHIVVVGAGGFGRETLDVIQAAIAAGAQTVLVGVVDSGPRDIDLKRLADRNVAFLGSETEWLSQAASTAKFIVAIGDPFVREQVAHRFAAAGLRAATVIHPRAVIGSYAEIGEGVVIAAGVQVSTNVLIGHHVHLNPGSIVGHDATLNDFVSINPGAIVSGNVTFGRGSLLGAGAVVLPSLFVGAGATVGAAACVVRSVAAETVVVGVPAQTLAKNAHD